MVPTPGSVVKTVDSSPVKNVMVNGQYFKGDTNPRQVIGLNGAIEPGGTHVIAFNGSDEMLRSSAQQVTGQLDFKPNETLVVRRLGGEMALNCRAQGYAYVINYPALPIVEIQDDGADDTSDDYFDVASPN